MSPTSWDELALITIPMVIAVEPVPEVIPIVVLEVPMSVPFEIPMSIPFVSLCGTLQAGECQQAETGRARERDKLRTH